MLNAIRSMGRKLRGKRINAVMLLLLLLLASIAGATYSFYTKDVAIENELLTKGSEVFLQELFNPNDRWLPGETKVKELTFGNQFETDQLIRFTYSIDWYKYNPQTGEYDVPWDVAQWNDSRGEYTTPTVSPAENFAKGVTLKWAGTFGNEWHMVDDALDNTAPVYYYKKVLKAAGTAATVTNPTLKAVTFSEKISNNEYYSGDDFSDKRCTITIRMEAVSADPAPASEAWGIACSISGDNVVWNG